MANGFVQRFQGKIKAAQVWLGKQQLNGNGAVLFYSTTGTQTLGNQGHASINASSAISIWTMGFGPGIGHQYTITFSNLSSGAFVKAASGVSFDNSTNTVFKSTYAMQVTLLGISSVAWRIQSVWPPPSTLVGGSGITLSTTT